MSRRRYTSTRASNGRCGACVPLSKMWGSMRRAQSHPTSRHLSSARDSERLEEITMRTQGWKLIPMVEGLSVLTLLATAQGGCGGDEAKTPTIDATLAAQGKDIFRMDTFGDETTWTDTLRMHEVIQAAVDPTTAL